MEWMNVLIEKALKLSRILRSIVYIRLAIAETSSFTKFVYSSMSSVMIISP